MMQITIPDDVYTGLHRYAQRNERPLQLVIVEQLRILLKDPLHTLPIDEQQELNALGSLSNSVLLMIAAEQMAAPLQSRLQTLMARHKHGDLAYSDYQELELLVERGDRLMLRKAEAAAILKQRGYPITQRHLEAVHA